MLDQAYRIVIEERVAELWAYRAWYRKHRWATWTEQRRDHMTELRALVRLARKARAVNAKADVDAIALYKWQRDRDSWTAA